MWIRVRDAVIFFSQVVEAWWPQPPSPKPFWVLISETDDCPGSCFWALLPKVLWALTHPRGENPRHFVQISSFQEQKSLWGFINSLTSPSDPSSFLLPRVRTLLWGCFPAPREMPRPLLPKHFVVPCLINRARSDLPFTALPEIDPLLRNLRNVLILWI